MFALAALDEVPPAVNLKCDPDLALELRDRYGPIPEAVEHLEQYGRIRIMADRLGVESIDRDLAAIDGAGSWRTLWRVIMPNAKPAVLTLVLLLFSSLASALKVSLPLTTSGSTMSGVTMWPTLRTGRLVKSVALGWTPSTPDAGLDAVAACLESAAPSAACHCWVEPVTRPNNRVGSAANCRPRVLTDLATVLICASVAPN